jgi:hypothetical protein
MGGHAPTKGTKLTRIFILIKKQKLVDLVEIVHLPAFRGLARQLLFAIGHILFVLVVDVVKVSE